MKARFSNLFQLSYLVPDSGKVLSINSDAKTIKSKLFGYLQAVIYLAPARNLQAIIRLRGGRYQNAPDLCRGECRNGCDLPCLFRAGRGVMTPVEMGRLNRTMRFLSEPTEFLNQVGDELRALCKRAKKQDLIPLFRPSGTSGYGPLRDPMLELSLAFPGLRAFDYSGSIAVARRYLGTETPVTLSRKGPADEKICRSFLSSGGNVAVVFSGDELPAEYYGAPVVNGDAHDIRLPEVDGEGVIVGLRLKRTKGNAAAIRSGFAVTL